MWGARRGIFGLTIFLAVAGIFFGFFLIIPNMWQANPYPPIEVGGGLILAGLGLLFFSSVKAKSTKYILTNQRILVTSFGRIVKEISLSSFLGRPLTQFLDVESVGYSNGQQISNVRITDPKTADFIELNNLNPSAVNILKKISQTVRCTYCKTNNSAFNPVCSLCNAPL